MLYERRARGTHVLQKLEHASIRESQIRRMNDRAGNPGQALHLGAGDHRALAHNAIEHGAIELNGALQILHGQSDVIEATH